jgi:hypothetical protein
MDIYFDGVRLGAVEEKFVGHLSKEEARKLYMDRDDVVIDMAPEPQPEFVEAKPVDAVWVNGVRVQ